MYIRGSSTLPFGTIKQNKELWLNGCNSFFIVICSWSTLWSTITILYGYFSDIPIASHCIYQATVIFRMHFVCEVNSSFSISLLVLQCSILLLTGILFLLTVRHNNHCHLKINFPHFSFCHSHQKINISITSSPSKSRELSKSSMLIQPQLPLILISKLGHD